MTVSTLDFAVWAPDEATFRASWVSAGILLDETPLLERHVVGSGRSHPNDHVISRRMTQSRQIPLAIEGHAARRCVDSGKLRLKFGDASAQLVLSGVSSVQSGVIF